MNLHTDVIDSLREDNERLRKAIATAVEDLVEVQNCLHGILHGGPAKREARELEAMLRKVLEQDE